jgi:hypothetical protein
LPAPLEPSRPVIPGPISTSRPASATVRPYRFTTPRAETTLREGKGLGGEGGVLDTVVGEATGGNRR